MKSESRPFKPSTVQIHLALLALVVFVFFLPALDGYFIADDMWQVSFAHKVLNGETELIWRNFTSNYLQLPSFDFYRPLMGFTFLADYALWRVEPFGYHLTNVLLHAVSSFLLYGFVRALTLRWPYFNSTWTAFLTALVFAVSPLHCEDVAWISGRADVLAAPFYLGSLCLIAWRHASLIDGSADLRKFPAQILKRWSFPLSLFLFALALSSKEIAVGLPAVVAAIFYAWPVLPRYLEPSDPEPVHIDEQEGQYSENVEGEKNDGSASSAASRRVLNKKQVGHIERALKGKRKKKKKGKAEDKVVSSQSSANESSDARIPDSHEKHGEAAPIEQGRLDATAGEASGNVSFSSSPPTFHKPGQKERILAAFHASWPFFLMAVIYMLIRFFALGTIIGGYSGMMGGALTRHVLLRWLDPINLERILLPFPVSIVGPDAYQIWIAGICLVGIAFLALVRLFLRSFDLNWLTFLSIWSFTTIAPLLNLWGVGRDLETSRLLYFFTMPLYLLLPVLVLHPQAAEAGGKVRVDRSLNRSIGATAIFVFCILSVTFGWTTYRTNELWTAAGVELKLIWRQTCELAQGLEKGQQVAILGIPKAYKGVHVNFNGSTFQQMLRPPFTEENLSSRVLTFEPFIVGPEEVVNTQRLERAVVDPNVKGPYFWRSGTSHFEPVHLRSSAGADPVRNLPFFSKEASSSWRAFGDAEVSPLPEKDGIALFEPKEGDGIRIEHLKASPLDYEFLEFDLSVQLKQGDLRALAPLSVSWNKPPSELEPQEKVVIALNLDQLKKPRKIRLQLSRYWRWFASPEIESLSVELFDAERVQISNACLVSGAQLIPSVDLPDLEPLSSGEFVVDASPVVLAYDGTHIDGCSSFEVEVSKPNYFFDNFLLGTSDSAVGQHFFLENRGGRTILQSGCFPKPAYYEVRLRALDSLGKPIGAWSESLAILKLGNGLETYIR